ncbi:ABC transporter ATP-binding protein [Desulfovermiculus halophilus]|jgi:subfamily B ATP-binding cassette protein MsbA|uniref:ABC transporter ATP-binding protein n=1 Tax=Desulfovermiculus halophilus TaxID=339722 RepID=UPI0004874AC3|nr:ABC transporter ATP-binding protein [Desulfovermiculus halophilus]
MGLGAKFHLRPRHKRILAYVRESWGKLALAMLCMLVVSATTSGTAFIVKPILDDIFMKQNERMLLLMPILVLLIYVFRGVAMFGQEYLMQYVGENIIKQLREDLYAKISDLSLSFFQQQKTGVLMSRITNDVNIIKTMVSTAVTGALRDVFTIVGLVFVIFYRDWQLALIAMVVLPVAFFPIYEFGRRIRRFSTRSQESMADLNAFLHETFAGNKIVKAFGMEPQEKARFLNKNQKYYRYEIKTYRIKALSSPIMEFLGGIGMALVIWYGGYGVIHGDSTPGTFFSFMTAVMMMYAPIKKLSKLNNAVQRGMAAADRVFDILETKSEIVEPRDPVPMPPPPHTVFFDHVGFAYAGNTSVLQDICLQVQPGERLGIVGTSGGGKTSLVNLIPRFYDPTSGTVRIDGIDIRSFAVSELRSRIGVVTQEPILFNDTVRANIAYGTDNPTQEQILDAARSAYLYDFIHSLPDGLDTVIGELGGRLSGGEKQRMCIARALLKDAPILILDEATSALDAEAEQLVQKALENLMQGRTSFVIAHRLSTVIDADRIIVLSGGRIVEQGSHASLMAAGGEYYRLYSKQFSSRSASS